MSRNSHSAVAHDIMFTINAVNKMWPDELMSLYGIEIFDGGKVLDTTYNKVFETVGEWAAFNVEQDDVEFEEHFHSKDTEAY